jgi:hypothetical protein
VTDETGGNDAGDPEDAIYEGFFGRLKNEMFYDRSWIGVGISELRSS